MSPWSEDATKPRNEHDSSRRRPPLSPSADSAAAASAAVAAGASGLMFSGGAASVVTGHHRTKSLENISRHVDIALSRVWEPDGDGKEGGGAWVSQPIVRVSLAVMAERTSPPGSTSGRRRSEGRRSGEGREGEGGEGSGDSSGGGGGGVNVAVREPESGGAGGGGGGGEGGGSSPDGSPEGSPKCNHVRVTLFVETPPAPPPPNKRGVKGLRSPPHQRTPSDVGLTVGQCRYKR